MNWCMLGFKESVRKHTAIKGPTAVAYFCGRAGSSSFFRNTILMDCPLKSSLAAPIDNVAFAVWNHTDRSAVHSCCLTNTNIFRTTLGQKHFSEWNFRKSELTTSLMGERAWGHSRFTGALVDLWSNSVSASTDTEERKKPSCCFIVRSVCCIWLEGLVRSLWRKS